MANGDRGIVTEAGADRLSLRTRDGRDVTIDAERYGGVRHGYAVTTHRAQGMSVDRVHVMAGRGMDAPLTYVAMTRQREGATLHASRDHFRDYATLRDAVGRDRRAYGVADYLPRQGGALQAVSERVRETQRMRAAERVVERTVGQGAGRGGEGDQDRGARLRAALAAQRSGPSEGDEARQARLREALERQARESGRDHGDATKIDHDLRARLRERAASLDGTDEARRDRLREALRQDGTGQQGADRGAERSAGRDRGQERGRDAGQDRGEGPNRGADRNDDRTLGNGPGRGGRGNDSGAGL